MYPRKHGKTGLFIPDDLLLLAWQIFKHNWNYSLWFDVCICMSSWAHLNKKITKLVSTRHLISSSGWGLRALNLCTTTQKEKRPLINIQWWFLVGGLFKRSLFSSINNWPTFDGTLLNQQSHTVRNVQMCMHAHAHTRTRQGKTTSASGHTVQADTQNVSTDRRLLSW